MQLRRPRFGPAGAAAVELLMRLPDGVRLLLLAEKHGLGDRVIGLLYKYCYEDGLNVSLRETVARAAPTMLPRRHGIRSPGRSHSMSLGTPWV